MSYIGSTPTTQSFIAGTDYFNGDGSTVAFTLSRSVVSVNDIEVVINNVEQQPNTAYTVSGTTITFTSAPSAGTANIYVRYLSTTTQSITPSQNTVSYNTLNSDNQSKLGISFKNRIINGAMVIDQRNAGASVSLSNVTTYTVDRFAVRTGTGSGSTAIQSSTAPTGFSKSLLVTIGTGASPSAGQVNYIYQAIEAYNLADLNWGTANAKTITLSFWVRSSVTGTFSGALRNDAADAAYPFTYTISAANTWIQASVTIVGPTIGTWPTNNTTGVIVFFDLGSSSAVQGTAGVWAAADYRAATGSTQLVITSGATLYITGVQFEVGTQATTFDYRSYGTELLLCQRYLPSWTAGQANGAGIYGSAYATTNVNFCYPYIVQPRVSPTGITTSGTFSLSDGNNVQNTTTVTFGGGGTCASFLDFVGTGFTTYRPMYFYGNSSAKILFTGCEL